MVMRLAFKSLKSPNPDKMMRKNFLGYGPVLL